MSSSWFPVWLALVGFAHAFSLFFLLLNSRVWRHSRSFLAAAWNRLLRREEGRDSSKRARACTLPPTPKALNHGPRRAVLAWRRLGCSYPAPGGGRKVVLQDAMGVVCQGELAALLGPSGGGKSTLLEMLAGRKALGELCGRVGLVSSRAAQKADSTLPTPTKQPSAPPLANSSLPVAPFYHPELAPAPEGPYPSLDPALQATHPDGVVVDELGACIASGGGESSGGSSSNHHHGQSIPVQEADGACLVWRGVRQHAAAVKRISAFVPQDSSFPASLTAEEVLLVQASLLGLGGKPKDLPGSAGRRPGQAQPPQEPTILTTTTTVITTTSPSGAAVTTTAAISPPSSGTSLRQRLLAAVMQSLHDVGLSQQASTLVGGPIPGGLTLRGLSGGERKRLSVAAGLLGGPQLLLLDEPTTGQDAAAAAGLMGHLASLCRHQGLTVLCSLHQPRASIWECLDTVVVLSQGYPIYSGPRPSLVPALERLGYHYTPTKHGSPANWVMDLVNISFDKPTEYFGHTITSREELAQAAAAAVEHWTTTHPQLEAEGGAGTGAEGRSGRGGPFASCLPCLAVKGGQGNGENSVHVTVAGGGQSVAPAGTAAMMSATSPAGGGQGEDGEVGDAAVVNGGKEPRRMMGRGARGGAPWWRQVTILMWRDAALVVRNPMDLVGCMLVFCWAGLVAGAVFYGLGFNIKGIVSRSVVSYVETILLFLLPFVYMSLYTADRNIITSELVAGLYRPSAYYVSKAVLLMAFSSLNSIVFSGVVYGMAGLEPRNESLIVHMLLATLGYLTAQQVLYCAAIVAPNQDIAFMIGILWTAVNILLSNYPIRLVEYTMSWVWPLKYVSAMYYTFSGLLAAQFRGAAPISCAGGLGSTTVKLLPSYLPNTPAVGSTFVQTLLTSPGADCELDLMTVITYFNVQWEWWVYALLLVAYLCVLHLASFGALLWAARREMR